MIFGTHVVISFHEYFWDFYAYIGVYAQCCNFISVKCACFAGIYKGFSHLRDGGG